MRKRKIQFILPHFIDKFGFSPFIILKIDTLNAVKYIHALIAFLALEI
jgi:hypothetical protein